MGILFDIKEFAVHDGAGVRTTVFLKGCPLRCVWCHNPEGQRFAPELTVKSGCDGCGRCHAGCTHQDCQPWGRCLHACRKGLVKVCGYDITADALAQRLLRDADIYRMGGGGVTFSGGEPLAQPAFLIETMDILRREGISCAVETSAFAPEAVFREVARRCDMVFCDIKLADSEVHRRYTGVGNELILKNAAWLQQSGIHHRFRTPLIPDITDTAENLAAVRAFAGTSPLELLPYNRLAGAKYAMLGRTYALDGAEEQAAVPPPAAK